MKNLIIKLVENDDDLLEIIELKRLDDSECIRENVTEKIAIDKVIKLSEEGYDFWLAKHNHSPIGYAGGIVKGENYRSEGIYVKPDFRGNEIGLELKKAQIEFARNLGCKEIYSYVAETNKSSRKLQEKMGFNFKLDGLVARLKL